MFLPILYPTPWQKKMLWNAITSLSLLVIAGIVVFTLYVTTQILAFLQPLILPVAVAGVFTYLLEPVGQLAGPQKAASASGCRDCVRSVLLGAVLLVVGVVPSIYTESVKFSSALPGYLETRLGVRSTVFSNKTWRNFLNLAASRLPHRNRYRSQPSLIHQATRTPMSACRAIKTTLTCNNRCNI